MGTQELINTIIATAGVLLAALITGVVTLIVLFVQTKRDGKTIDSIDADTTDIKPKVDNTNSAVNSIAKDVVKIAERNSKIDAIATEIEVFRRLKGEADGAAIRPEALLAGISAVLEENALLKKEVRELRFQNRQLKIALWKQSHARSDSEKDHELEF